MKHKVMLLTLVTLVLAQSLWAQGDMREIELVRTPSNSSHDLHFTWEDPLNTVECVYQFVWTDNGMIRRSPWIGDTTYTVIREHFQNGGDAWVSISKINGANGLNSDTLKVTFRDASDEPEGPAVVDTTLDTPYSINAGSIAQSTINRVLGRKNWKARGNWWFIPSLDVIRMNGRNVTYPPIFAVEIKAGEGINNILIAGKRQRDAIVTVQIDDQLRTVDGTNRVQFDLSADTYKVIISCTVAEFDWSHFEFTKVGEDIIYPVRLIRIRVGDEVTEIEE